ncbi:MAG: TrbC/VirB2 family protein [Synergistaceae bacterium]|jgi:type IV secretory pathway VirB2 component (pilin)|nr:TrbC/VirB2 family protein [Synergistaceae bacterium]
MKSQKRKNITKVTSVTLIVLSALCLAGTAEANTSTNFPWDSALKQLADSLTGPVAFSLGLFMIVCGFCAVAFVGSELGGWVRWVALAAILAGMLGAAPTVLGMFGLQSAMIA